MCRQCVSTKGEPVLLSCRGPVKPFSPAAEARFYDRFRTPLSGMESTNLPRKRYITRPHHTDKQDLWLAARSNKREDFLRLRKDQ